MRRIGSVMVAVLTAVAMASSPAASAAPVDSQLSAGAAGVSPAPAPGPARAAAEAAGPVAAPAADPLPSDGWVLGSDRYVPADYSRQPYLGNGFLGAVIPATGQGYQGNLGGTGWPLYTPRYTGSFAAGVYGWSGGSELIAGLPTWSTMTLGVGAAALTPGTKADQISDYRQQLDLRTGSLSTELTWTAPDGRTSKVGYQIVIDREKAGVAMVRMTLQPQWSGTAQVQNLIDGAGARRVTSVGATTDAAASTATVTVRGQSSSQSMNVRTASITTALQGIPDGASIDQVVDPAKNTAGQTVRFPVTSGASYQLTKYVGVASSEHDADPVTAALAMATGARNSGWTAVKKENDAAWAQLWQRRIEVADPALQQRVNASVYTLLASMRPGQQTSIAPAALSSDTYAGMIFWDAETWMYPSLLALYPELARSVVDLRFNTLEQAKRNATRVGRSGAVWPWSNGPSMGCGGPGPCIGSQDHLQSEIALAQWQYYLATGDKQWLATRGWPVIQQLAVFWQHRVTRGADGKFHINKVDGADEYARQVSDHALTNAGAATTMRIATQAAKLVGEQADPQWAVIADQIYIPYDKATDTHPEYAGYAGQKIKQADTVLMAYPYEFPMAPSTVAADLDTYAAVTDPDGPAMTDSVHAVLAAQVAEPGCQTWTYLQRSVEPFVREPFYSFSEARGSYAGDNAGAPAFVFTTGAGGFLQSLLYGLTGQRWRTDRITFEPLLPPQMAGGVTVRGMQYAGRSVTFTLGARTSTVRVDSGPALTVQSGGTSKTLAAGQQWSVDTRRPDLASTPNLARCRPGTVAGSALGNYSSAGNDGSVATAWRTADGAGSYTVELPRPTPVGQVRIDWAGTPPADYRVETSTDGTRWSTLGASGAGAPSSTAVIAPARPQLARWVRVTLSGGDKTTGITEIAAYGPGNRGEPSVQLQAPAQLTSGTPATVTATLRNPTTGTLTGGSVELRLPKGWTATPAGPVAVAALRPGASIQLSWTVRPADAAGTQTLTVLADWADGSAPLRNTATVTVLPAPPRGRAYLSDLPWLSAVNGYGPVERDRDNGEQAAGDGGPLTLSGTVYPKGLGTNADATITFYLGGACSRFSSVVGIDDSMVASGGNQGDVVFRVLGDDGAELANTSVVRGGDAPRTVSLDVSGVQRLTLQVDKWDADNWWDHADWADATVSCRP